MENRRSFHIGDAIVQVFNSGMLRADLAEWFGVARDAGPEAFRSDLAGDVSVPVQCVHVQCGATSLLVDACIYDLTPDSPHAIPGYEPPPSLVDQMTAAGIDVDDIDHVVITHAHFDHFNGLIEVKEGLPTPVYSGAQVYLGRADWESPEIQEALKTPGSVESRVLGTLAKLGKLTLVDGEIELADGITVFPSPGETLGHQSVRVESSGEVLYCIGDLYHHAVELVEPTWAVIWADGKTIASSRAALKRRVAGERAKMIATHISEILQSDAIG
jgi:glyoxylase-like metal-dependent hydrolase (beta-lactamase superfamily II)